MIVLPEIDPIMFQIGPVAFRWYGLMYSMAFIIGWPLVTRRAKKFYPQVSPEMMNDLLVWIILGVVLGGRFGYMIFYQSAYYMSNPMSAFRVWEGGMSFHGGLLGVLIAGYWFGKRRGITFLDLSDLITPIVPLGLFLGRIGNFINGELWGRVSDVPWAMVFPGAGSLARHPSQLYEAALEGILLFAILWWQSRKKHPPGYILGLFALFYAFFRFMVEFVREPDAHLGLLSMGLSMGQWLCLPMALIGYYMMRRAYRKEYESTTISG